MLVSRVISILLVSVFLLQDAIASSLSVDKKELNALPVHKPPKIDGHLDDLAWEKAEIASNFVQYSPYNGAKAAFRTEVRVLYDHTAIYIGAKMYDPYPDSILTQLGQRDADRELNADQFSFDINPFNDGVNGMTFKVSASGVKTDKIRTSSSRHGSDKNWDAVWKSDVSIDNDGWSVEMKIPYSALRFPKTAIQQWGVNFWREIRRRREWSTWNYVNNEVGNSFNYLGELMGIKNIKPPLRLSVSPYVSGYLEKSSESSSWSSSYNGGMDLKYGINQSFTLDMTLIPDFGQVQSDDKVLNLTPFEVKYNEKRQFFTEGTELFNKGGIFYSRRVGGRPNGYRDAWNDLSDTEEVISNPAEAKLINATKVSGRTEGGLGIGFFNGMTKRMYAEIKDTESGETRKVLTQPFTNYNMLVFDQGLKNNSYLSFQNTNVLRDAPKEGNNYMANVTSTDFKLLNKSNLYSVSGQAALSQKYYDSLDTDLGYRVNLTLGKTGGVFRAYYETEIISDSYDPNDMGYERKSNEMSHQGTFSYNIFKPVGIIQSSRNSFEIEYTSLYKPATFSELKLSLNTFTSFMNFWYTMIEVQYTPLGKHDFYEPRVDNRSYYRYPTTELSSWVSTDRRKKLYGRFRFNYEKPNSPYNQNIYQFGIGPTFRMNDRLSLSYNLMYTRKKNDIGYVFRNSERDTIVFGMRNNLTIENTIESNLIFTSRSYLSFRLRHYWSRVDYTDQYFYLKDDGYLDPANDFEGTSDINFNIFNIDMVYVWRFAPGSEMSVVWKNAISSFSDKIINDVGDNLNYMFNSPQINSFSVKILYYLDYQYLRRKS